MAKCPTRRWGAVARSVPAAALAVGLAFSLLTGTAGAASSPGKSALSTARKALLVLSDMPKGWMSSSSSGGNSSFPGEAQLATCIGVPKSVITSNPPSATSPDFNSKDDLLMVGDSVAVYRHAKLAAAEHAALGNAKTPGCMTTIFNGAAKASIEKSFGSGTTLGAVVVARTPTADYAPGTINLTLYFPIISDGVTVNVQITEVDYVRGNEEGQVTFTAFNSTFPASLSRSLMALADKRL
jgi:hypothetical protein